MTEVTLPFAIPAIQKIKLAPDQVKTYYLGWYFPSKNSHHKADQLSQSLLHLSTPYKTDTPHLDKIVNLLSTLLKPDTVLCAVPHVNHLKVSSTTKIVEKMLASGFQGTAVELARTRTIADIQLDTFINSDDEIASLEVKNEVAGKTIVLLDTVLTTGRRLAACRKKLLDAGADTVICLALGKTLPSNDKTVQISQEQFLLSKWLCAKSPLIKENQTTLKAASPALHTKQCTPRLGKEFFSSHKRITENTVPKEPTPSCILSPTSPQKSASPLRTLENDEVLIIGSPKKPVSASIPTRHSAARKLFNTPTTASTIAKETSSCRRFLVQSSKEFFSDDDDILDDELMRSHSDKESPDRSPSLSQSDDGIESCSSSSSSMSQTLATPSTPSVAQLSSSFGAIGRGGNSLLGKRKVSQTDLPGKTAKKPRSSSQKSATQSNTLDNYFAPQKPTSLSKSF